MQIAEQFIFLADIALVCQDQAIWGRTASKSWIGINSSLLAGSISKATGTP